MSPSSRSQKITPLSRVLLVDMDGVLCAYNEKLIAAGLVRPEELTHERWEDCGFSPQREEAIRKLVYSDGFFESLDPIPASPESLEALLSSGWDVYVCSRPPMNPRAWGGKYLWIQRHCPFLSGRVILTSCKALVKGHAFIDDSLQSLMEWQNGTKILLQTNRHLAYDRIPKDILHFRGWSELLHHLNNFFKEGPR